MVSIAQTKHCNMGKCWTSSCCNLFFSFLVFWNNPRGLMDDVFHSMQGPAKKWEKFLLGLEVAGSEPGIDGEEIAPQAKENVATP